VVWGPGEEADAAAVVRAAEGSAVLAPATDLAVLAALLSGARLFVGGDSGPLHLACAAGSPVLAIYGPTDPEVNRPWGVPYRVVHPAGASYRGVKRHDRGIGFANVRSDDVERGVDALLAASAPPSERM
jgi:ADP-heptose:LPS heptosyltransferase